MGEEVSPRVEQLGAVNVTGRMIATHTHVGRILLMRKNKPVSRYTKRTKTDTDVLEMVIT